MADRLPPHQYALVKALAQDLADPSVENLAKAAKLDQALLSAAAVELEGAGLVAINNNPYTEYKLGELGQAIGKGEAVLPERMLVTAVARHGGSAGMKDLGADEELKNAKIVPGKFAKSVGQIGWATFDKGTLTLQGDAAEGDPPPCAMEAAISAVAAADGVLVIGDDTPDEVKDGGEQLKNRKELLTVRERNYRTVALTAEGQALAGRMDRGEVTELREENELTPEMLSDGSWRDVQFRAYDVTLSAEDVTGGKTHPLSRVIELARLAFLELGFSEASCPMAESAFWDFDALFQPQDHPAREMQDTFYMVEPAKFPLPDEEMVERVRRTHEDGWETGSRGWRYEWSPERAMQVVLRTHMTASSIRAIARNPKGPQKVFSIGRVFRRETVDYKHLPEFYQVDGIIIDEHADFASLLGTLATFCARLGIPEVRFKPDFFPYTEPSAGVEAKVNGRWLELAGSGIFRPEVTRPFGCTAPVLAWGFGLERLAMAKFNAPTIKDLYQSDFDWLKAAPLEG